MFSMSLTKRLPLKKTVFGFGSSGYRFFNGGFIIRNNYVFLEFTQTQANTCSSSRQSAIHQDVHTSQSSRQSAIHQDVHTSQSSRPVSSPHPTSSQVPTTSLDHAHTEGFPHPTLVPPSPTLSVYPRCIYVCSARRR